MSKIRPTRYAAEKICTNAQCDLAGQVQPAVNFTAVRAGGTSDVCRACQIRSRLETKARAAAHEAEYQRLKRLGLV